MSKGTDQIEKAVSDFLAYKPDRDQSAAADSKTIFEMYSKRDSNDLSASVSTFVGLVRCPYRIWNVGAGHRPRFSETVLSRMNKGAKKHRIAEQAIRQKSVDSIARGGPPDLQKASRELLRIPTKDLLEAPEVSIQMSIEGLDLRGRVDGLLRSDGIITAIERKPRSGWFKPASALQAMTYAIGGCLHLKDHTASIGAAWVVTDYEGVSGPSGRITEVVCDLVSRLGAAYTYLVRYGANKDDIPGLRGPAPGKCASCEFVAHCKFRCTESVARDQSDGEPIWMKYAKGKGRNRRS